MQDALIILGLMQSHGLTADDVLRELRLRQRPEEKPRRRTAGEKRLSSTRNELESQ